MNAMQNFAFEEHLVRVVERDGEPWFVGKDVCAALGIKNHNDALADLDDDEKGVATTDPLSPSVRGGGPQETVIVSEPGVYRLVFRSRKPEAERFKRWLAHEVLPMIRRTGRYDAAAEASGTVPEPLGAKVALLNWITRGRGFEVAAAYMTHLGMEPLPTLATPPDTEPEECLRHLLDWRVEGETVADLLSSGEGARRLERHGVKLFRDTARDGFLLANAHDAVAAMFAGTRWRGGLWKKVLRRLPGAGDGGSTYWFAPAIASRATFVPWPSSLSDSGPE